MTEPDESPCDAGAAYAVRQQSRDEDYREAYAEWIASLSPEERRQVEELGVDEPSVPGAGTGAPSGDMAESPRASCGSPGDAPVGDEPAEDPGDERLHDLLRRLIGELIGQDNARLSLECLALVTGLAYCGDSMTDIAKRHGVTRAAVSKRCVELTRALNVKPSRAMRSLPARRSYRRARLQHLESQS